MSKWADLYSRFDDNVHTVPVSLKKLPKHTRQVHKHVFGHVPTIDCHCKPHVRFSDDGEYLVVNHRDPERGSCTVDLETLQ